MLKGIVIDDSTEQVLPYAHIYNESKRSGCISDKEGHFKIHADPEDTLVISALGYLGIVNIVEHSDFITDKEIRLIPRLYEIEAVNIKGFRDYSDFQRQFIALEIPKTKIDLLRENLASLSYSEGLKGAAEKKVRDALSPQPGKPIPNGIPILYREDLQRINYARVLKQEQKQHIINKKYNREIIYKITKLSQDEITDFMSFCNFSTDYLFYATEYDILVSIEKKFLEYLEKKSRGELLPRPNFNWFFYT